LPRPAGWRRLFVACLVCLSALICVSAAQARTLSPAASSADTVTPADTGAPALNLDTLTGAQAEQMLENGTLTSVQLVEAYEARISALNKSGPGLNAVTQINPAAMAEAQQADTERAEGIDLGPAMGLPILLKDIIDVKGMATTAGDWALRASYPAQDSGVAKELLAHGVIILGKAGLSEWANSFGHNPNGFSNLTGQVLNAMDTGEDPSGSSSGSASSASSGLASLTIGTETSGSIISPSTAQSDVGIRPTVGIVPGYGIAPISVSQDGAGPIERTVTDAAMALQSITEVPGSDPTAAQEYLDLEGPNAFTNDDIPTYTAAESGSSSNTTLPNYMSALTTSFVKGKRIGYSLSSTCTLITTDTTPTCNTSVATTQQQQAYLTAISTLTAAGATVVEDDPVSATTAANACTSAYNSTYEYHATIDEYYRDLGPQAPVQSLAQEVQIDNTDPQEAEKFSNSAHAAEAAVDDSTDAAGVANQQQYQAALPCRKAAYQGAINSQLNNPSDGNGPVIAVLGTVNGNGPTAGFPEMALPYGYTTTQRRPLAIDINGGAYDERNIIGIGYVLEQADQGTANARQPAADIDPAAYRCAHTAVAEPFASRGHCNPDYTSVMAMLGGVVPATPSFSLETTSASQLEAMMAAGTLTSQQLVEDELYRIAQSNANGPAIQAIRALNPYAIKEAAASDSYRAANGDAEGPLEGIPVLVNDTMDAKGLATSGGSIALENNYPAADSALVANLKAKGAIILGDTNGTELNGAFDPNMTQGYSSLGSQVLNPYNTDLSLGGSSAGSAAAVAAGFAPLAVGMETSTNTALAGGGGAQIIAPAANAGIVALKPTPGLVSETGVIPVASTQDSIGPMGQTVADVADEMTALAGNGTNYATGLSTTALVGKGIATVTDTGNASTTDGYAAAVTEVGQLGATTAAPVTPGAATTSPSVIPYEQQAGLNAYLASSTDPDGTSLNGIIAYNNANPTEGLKFQQEYLTQSAAIDETGDSTGTTNASTNAANVTAGQTADQGVINTVLGSNSAIIVPQTSSLVDIADRAGDPVITVPTEIGATTDTQLPLGGDPYGVDFIGPAGSDSALLGDAYAYEQGTQVRNDGPADLISTTVPNPGLSGAPSEVNQSMWRCVVGSSFYSPYSCNVGDLQSETCLSGMEIGCQTTGTGTTTTTTTTTTTPTTTTPTTSTPTTTTTSTPTTTSPSTTTTPTTKPIGALKVTEFAGGAGKLAVKYTCPATDASCTTATITATFVEGTSVKGKVTVIKPDIAIYKTLRVAFKSITAKPGKTVTVNVPLTKFGASVLAGTAKQLRVTVKVTAGGKTLASKVVTITKVKAKKATTKK
jgi:amidase